LNGLSGRRSIGEIENDFLTEEDEVLKGQEHSIGAFITEAVRSGDKPFMGGSWLKRGVCIRNVGVYSRRRDILPGVIKISSLERKSDGFGR